MIDTLNKISSEAVKKATGKTWDAWVRILDKAGARRMTHKEIARMLHDEELIHSGWWCQAVTVGYEYARNKRTLGESTYQGFEIGVTKTMHVTPEAAWRFLTRPAGVALWLGKISSRLPLKPGAAYETVDGVTGEIRTLKPGARIRLTWQTPTMKKPTILQLTVTPRQSTRGTCIRFHHEKLAGAKERVRMRAHWQSVLKKIESALVDMK